MALYNEKVMEHFKHPKNMGKLEHADGIGKVGNPVCGDTMHVYIAVKEDRIVDIKFETFGCVSAIATSSMVTELAKGKTLADAEKITNARIDAELGGLPNIKRHCSDLASEALRAAIVDYRDKNPEPQRGKKR